MGSAEGGVREFYAGRAVFITGGTGYLGKVTVEKLLYSCPEVGKLYLMVRHKRGKTADSRLRELTSSPAFDRLRSEQPTFGQKIVLVEGDMAADKLGMSEADIERVTADTSVIIHNAATIRFTEPLKKATRINVLGVRQMLNLAKQMEHLQAFVHVSTAFSNCDKEFIPEALMPQRLTPDELIHTVSWMNEWEVAALTPRVLGNYPNTYTFTKGVAEHLVDSEKGNMAVCIVRPSVILSSVSDPVPGWMDGLSGANGVLALQGLGIMRKMYGRNTVEAAIVPADLTANASIVAGWKLARDTPRDTIIVNMTAHSDNSITWGKLYALGGRYQHQFPCQGVLRPPAFVVFTPQFWRRQILKIFDHYIPAAIFDLCSLLTGNKPTYLLRAYGLWKFAHAVEYFAYGKWHFAQGNSKLLTQGLSAQERQTFNMDVLTVNWEQFIKDWWLGAKKYVFKDEPSSQPECDKRLQRLYWRRRVVRCSLVLGFVGSVLYGTRDFTAPYLGQLLDHLPSNNGLVTRCVPLAAAH